MRRRLALVALLLADYDEALSWLRGRLGLALAEDRTESAAKRRMVMSPGSGGADLVLAKAADEAERALVGRRLAGRVGFFLYTDDCACDHAAMTARGAAFREASRAEP